MSEWDNYIGPETPTKHQGRPYIDTGRMAMMHWSDMHKWCQRHGLDYSWNGSRFNFDTLDDLLYFCNHWMIEDIELEEEF